MSRCRYCNEIITSDHGKSPEALNVIAGYLNPTQALGALFRPASYSNTQFALYGCCCCRTILILIQPGCGHISNRRGEMGCLLIASSSRCRPVANQPARHRPDRHPDAPCRPIWGSILEVALVGCVNHCCRPCVPLPPCVCVCRAAGAAAAVCVCEQPSRARSGSVRGAPGPPVESTPGSPLSGPHRRAPSP